MRSKRKVELGVKAVGRGRNDPNINRLKNKTGGLWFKIIIRVHSLSSYTVCFRLDGKTVLDIYWKILPLENIFFLFFPLRNLLSSFLQTEFSTIYPHLDKCIPFFVVLVQNAGKKYLLTKSSKGQECA